MGEQYYNKNTTIFKYIKQSYKKSGKQVPVSVLNILRNFNISNIPVQKFKAHFGLDNIQVQQLIEFIMAGENSVDIARYGWESYELMKSNYSHRKYTAFDDYSYGEPRFNSGNLSRKI